MAAIAPGADTLREAILLLRRHGATIILSTHDMAVAETLESLPAIHATGTGVAAVVANRVLSQPSGSRRSTGSRPEGEEAVRISRMPAGGARAQPPQAQVSTAPAVAATAAAPAAEGGAPKPKPNEHVITAPIRLSQAPDLTLNRGTLYADGNAAAGAEFRKCMREIVQRYRPGRHRAAVDGAERLAR